MSEHSPRLYLVSPLLDPAADSLSSFLPALTRALDAGDVASVLLRVTTTLERDAEKLVRAVATPVQARDVALVIDGAPETALRAGADGVQMAGCGEDFTDALKKLSPRYIVGAGALATRDDAMRAGETGADYVLFGDRPTEGDVLSRDELVERVAWWTELFTTPSVALARTPEEVGPLAAAGADFIMLGDWVWSDSRGAEIAVAEAAKSIGAVA